MLIANSREIRGTRANWSRLSVIEREKQPEAVCESFWRSITLNRDQLGLVRPTSRSSAFALFCLSTHNVLFIRSFILIIMFVTFFYWKHYLFFYLKGFFIEYKIALLCSAALQLQVRKDACWRCMGAAHVAKECKAPPRCLTCADRDEKAFAHASGSGSCPIFRAELQRLRGRNWSSCSSTSGKERKPRTFWCRLPRRGGPLCCSLVSSTNGPKTLLGTRIQQGRMGSLFAALI